MATVTITLDDQIRCVRRELALRERCYPAWVRSNRMTQGVADRELLMMQAVLDTLLGMAKERMHP